MKIKPTLIPNPRQSKTYLVEFPGISGSLSINHFDLVIYCNAKNIAIKGKKIHDETANIVSTASRITMDGYIIIESSAAFTSILKN